MPEQLSVDRRPTEEEKRRLIASTRRFDLRRILGALFLLYGVLTTIVGLVHGAADLTKTGGIAINLWAGIAMIVLGVLFLIWDRLSPVPEEDIVKILTQEDANEAADDAEGSR
ncbi:hypothetical protein [Amnibacterium sp.]|uniref:hypothetical protein n=1 Tax=Amnibacterium sp. TaxID=1872496 RepID=UPI00263947C5|nr:hypothetical protein [Amnibacterium sp.]MCU1473192.1 hypothetical protein [Amnibacterium sp.]